MKKLSWSSILVCCLLILMGGNGWTEKERGSASAPHVDKAKMALGAWRGSQIIGINVYNPEGDRVGAIADIVGDVKGKILYVILSHGGFLGIGDKMIPLPWWTIRPGKKPNTLEVPLSKQALREAPNFDANAWPDFSRSEWSKKTKQYYQVFRGKDPRPPK